MPNLSLEKLLNRRSMLFGTAALAAVPALSALQANGGHGQHSGSAGGDPAPLLGEGSKPASSIPDTSQSMMTNHAGHAGFAGGSVPPERAGIDPTAILRDFDRGKTSTLPDGRTLREWDIVAVDQDFEIAPGVNFPGWSYNGRIPGPTLWARGVSLCFSSRLWRDFLQSFLGHCFWAEVGGWRCVS
ncbi:hypothetical protein ACFFHP_11920, partial [Glutamicibacter ardleyensis]